MSNSLTSAADDALDTAPPYEQNEGQGAANLATWTGLLATVLEDVLPGPAALPGAPRACAATANIVDSDALNRFVQLVVADNIEQLRAIAAQLMQRDGGRDALLHGVLKPAALRLGEMWDQDLCDFVTVTLGVYRLNQIMRETASAGTEWLRTAAGEHCILLLPAPGEQHSFGAAMVGDAFRQGGWCVRAAPGITRGQLLRLVRGEWFDVVGLSVSAERSLKGLSACIRAIRAVSVNRDVFIMAGGYAIIKNAERARFLGVDYAAVDADSALRQADLFMATRVTRRLCQSKTDVNEASRAL